MPSPSFVPVIATGRDVSFATVTVTGALKVTPGGAIEFGNAAGVTDTFLYRSGANALTTDGALTISGFTAMGAAQTSGNLSVFGSALILGVAGTGLQIKEGANATSGTATLVAGTVTVPTNKVTATSRIQLTPQALGTVTSPKSVGVTARTAGTSFVITSADPTDTSPVGWTIIEPAA
jgi:hypothetical protein